MSPNNKKGNLKQFFIKLISITFAIIIIINTTYNLIFADKLEAFNTLFNITEKRNIEATKDKIRIEIERGLNKDKILKKDDAILLKKIFLKIKKELDEAEKK
jgi:hypothetical protein